MRKENLPMAGAVKQFFLPLILCLITINAFQHTAPIPDMDTLIIHYHRYDGQYNNWTLWSWAENSSKEFFPTDKDAFGLIFKIALDSFPSTDQLGLLPKYKNWEAKDDPNRYWHPQLPGEIWLLEGDPTIYTSAPDTATVIRKAFLESPTTIILVFSNQLSPREIKNLKLKLHLSTGSDLQLPSAVPFQPTDSLSRLAQVTLTSPLKIEQLPATLETSRYGSCPLYLRGILDQPEYISDRGLGINYTPQKTDFAVYAPGAEKVILKIYDQPIGGQAQEYHLQPQSDGVWQTTVKGDLMHKYYVYSVSGRDPRYRPDKEINDPYARCVTTHDGRALIFRDDTPIAPPPSFPIQDAIIYEIHVRDFTISENSGAKHKGLYLGFTEEGTTIPGTNVATCLDHLTELGINTVQLLPVQDFEHDNRTNSYFWGYMTVNFNSPDGWYTTNENDASRVREFKLLVDALHRRGIKVILDVVYNHTAEGSPEVCYNFNGFAPGFYYRQKPDGTYWNGSGCGNEVRTEHPMVRRFIIESLKYWVETYQVDGFRFDLMGLFDLETMLTIVKTLRAIRPDIFLYGEPWTAGPSPITPITKGMQKRRGFAVFNDHFRDALKGPWYNTEPGYIQTGKNVDAVKKGIMGSIHDFAAAPTEVINYVSCHDGRTLWDQLVASTENLKTHTDTELKAMDKLAAFIIFTSQGIPFMQGGEEFLRTKFGSHNSYNLPDKINKIRWDFKIENRDIFEYYKGLIQLRKEHPMFRMATAAEVQANLKFLDQLGYPVPKDCIAYRLSRGQTGDSWREVLVLINPHPHPEKFTIPKAKWILTVDHTHAGTDIIAPVNDTIVEVKPFSALLMYRP